MNLGVILPHTKLYGGVKRFRDLGNKFIEKGHNFTVFTPEGLSPDWFKFKDNILQLETLPSHTLDALFLTETSFLKDLYNSSSKRKILYHVAEFVDIRKVNKYPGVEVFACSWNIYDLNQRKHGMDAFKAFGGIDTRNYFPKNTEAKHRDTFTVISYGRLAEKRKGTMMVVKACEQIYKKKKNIRLLLFDSAETGKINKYHKKFKTIIPHEFILNHPVHKNVELFHRADIFASCEKRAGWANTAAEAMASGLPVVATASGSKDFLIHNETGLVVKRNVRSLRKEIEHLMNNPNEIVRLGKAGRLKIEDFDWGILADQILDYLSES